MIRTILKLLLCVMVYAIVFIFSNVIMPFSESFKALGFSESGNPLPLTVISALVCFTVYYVVRHSNYTGIKLFLNLVFVLFFVQLFMAQIETALFGHAFPALTKLDILLIMFAGLLPLLVTVPIMIKFFQNNNAAAVKVPINNQPQGLHCDSEFLDIKPSPRIDYNSLIIKLCMTGIIYACIYMIFGYFVAWQFEELRIFYSGSPDKLSFFGQLAANIKTSPVIYPFQVLRGVLFGVFVIPLINMTDSKKVFIADICLVYSYLGYIFILPNVLFPDMVRVGHFIEMTSSMLIFGIIVGNILWPLKRPDNIIPD